MKKLAVSASALKLVLIAALVLLFLIPISLIKNLVRERKVYQREAISSIVQPLGGESQFEGVCIAVPYKVHTEHYEVNGAKRIETQTRYIIFAPAVYNLAVSVNPYYLTRGIFKVPVFNGKMEVQAEFSPRDYSYFDIFPEDVLEEEALLILGLSNTKNLTSQPKFFVNGEELSISPISYTAVSPFTTSVFYRLPLEKENNALSLSGTVGFQGGEGIKITPIAADNAIKMTSPWTSPSFSGGWLPSERTLSPQGFKAFWSIAGLSTVWPRSWRAENKFTPESVSVSFIIPVDAYKKTERSVKYALLFLLIPFIALLVSEVFSGIKIHPVQYCLIGFADIIFYLLLLSVSEHLSFNITYAICALSVSLLTFFYAAAIFKSVKQGLLLSAVQFISYIFLYGTLQAEDYALLIGSIGLFAVLSFLMFITRKIDWYALGKSENTTD